jgi:hypothetical protein
MAQAVPFIAAAIAGGGQAIAAYKKSKYHDRRAIEYREAKNRRMAAATREAAEERRKQEYIHSRAVAVAAASGGGTGAGVVKIFADLAAEGEYRVLSRLWQGQNDAEGFLAAAKAEERASNDAITMGVVKSITSAFSAFMSAGGSMPSFGGQTTPPASATDFAANRAYYGGSGQMAISPDGLPYSPIPDAGNVGKLWKGP